MIVRGKVCDIYDSVLSNNTTNVKVRNDKGVFMQIESCSKAKDIRMLEAKGNGEILKAKERTREENQVFTQKLEHSDTMLLKENTIDRNKGK